MSYQLVIREQPGKDAGDNIFFDHLPADYKVYALYYPSEMGDTALESKLRNLGNLAGGNLFVNLGRLDDPQYGMIARRFELKDYPVIVITAIASLASPANEYMVTYARLDSKHLLNSPDRAVDCVQKLYALFMQGKVAEAIAKAKWTQRAELLSSLTHVFTDALTSVGGFIASRDISVSFAWGKLEIKPSGE